MTKRIFLILVAFILTVFCASPSFARRIKDDSIIGGLEKAGTIGARIKFLRNARGLSARELAQGIGASDEDVVFDWEREKFTPRSWYIPQLAGALGVDPWILVTGKSRAEALREADNIGERIYLCRYTKGFMQEEVAYKIGVSDGSYISNWERGRQNPVPYFIPLLASALEIDAWVLVTGKNREEALREVDSMGERIDICCYINGLMSEELAEKIGCSVHAIRSWKQQRAIPQPYFIPLLANALGIDVWLLITGKSREEALREVDGIGRRIYLFRISQGLTQEELAKRIGVTQACIGYWEREDKTPTPHFIPLLAQTLGIDAWVLVTGEDREDALRETNGMGERIRISRGIIRLTQEELAKRIGLQDASIINGWEQEKYPPEMRFLELLAETLDVDIHLLITGKTFRYEYSGIEKIWISELAKSLNNWQWKEIADKNPEQIAFYVRELAIYIAEIKGEFRDVWDLSANSQYFRDVTVPCLGRTLIALVRAFDSGYAILKFLETKGLIEQINKEVRERLE